jgi:GxxExxY protein
MDDDKITEAIIGAAIRVHKQLGPGLLESTYEACTAYELTLDGWDVVRQKVLPITYRNLRLDDGYRIDLLVAQRVIVEIKAVDVVLPVHEAQLLTYLRLADLRVGLLINFNVPLLKNGVHRLVNGYLSTP